MDSELNSPAVIELQAPSMAHRSKIIEEYRTSERSELRTIAAPPIPPAISTAAYADDGGPAFEASAVVPSHMADNAVAAARQGKAIIKVMRKAFVTKERKPSRLPVATPQARRPRARAIHSHVVHGGARKRDSGSDGDGDGPPGTASLNLTPRDLDGCTGSATDDGSCYTGLVFYAGKAFARVVGDNPDSFAGETIPVAEWRDGRRLLARLGKIDDFSRGYDGDDDSADYRIVAVIWARNDDAIAS